MTEQPTTEPTHEGPDPSHGGLTTHRGRREDCTGPDCGPAEEQPAPLSEAVRAAGRMAAEGFARGIAQAEARAAEEQPRSPLAVLADQLDEHARQNRERHPQGEPHAAYRAGLRVAARIARTLPANDEQPRPHPDPDADRLAVLDGRDALAFVVIRPADDNPAAVTVEAGARGMSKAAAAYTLRATADQFDTAARAEGDEPIPYALTEQAEALAEQPTRHILGDDEYEAAYAAARGTLGRHAARVGSVVLADALTAALAAVGILTPAPAPDPDECPAMFADLTGEWHQCTEDPHHDPADGHSDGEWSWPHGDTYARPEPDEDDAEPASPPAILAGIARTGQRPAGLGALLDYVAANLPDQDDAQQ
ncbi:hypothetical protein [Streptomyces sp. NPDC000994]